MSNQAAVPNSTGPVRTIGLLVLGIATLALAVGVATALASKSASGLLAGGEAGITGGLFGGLDGPGDIAVNQSTGQVYVADPDNRRIQRFGSDGAFELAWGRGVVTPGGSGDNGGSNDQQTIAISATGGTYLLRWTPWSSLVDPYEETPPIAFDASAAAVQAALESLSYVDPGDVLVSGPSGGPFTVEFAGQYAATDVFGLSTKGSGLTGGGISTSNPQSPAANAEICTVASECRPGATGPAGDDPGGEIEGDPRLAIGSNGHVYVAAMNNRVAEFDADGNFVRAWGSGVVQAGGAGDKPTNETQRISYAPGWEGASGAFGVTFLGDVTAPVPFDATPAQLQAALEGLPDVAPGDVSVTGLAGGPWTVEFKGAFADIDVTPMDVELENNETWTGDLKNNGLFTIETKTAAGGFEICTVASQCRAGSIGGDAAGQLGGGSSAPVAAGAGGEVFVGDAANSRIAQYEPDGDFVRAWGWGVDTESLAFEICTAASGCNRGLRFFKRSTPANASTPHGQFVTTSGAGDPGRPQPTRIAVDADGIVYASNADAVSGGGSIPVGPRLDRFDSTRATAGELLMPAPIRSISPPNGLPVGPLPNQFPNDLEADPTSRNLYYLADGEVSEIDPALSSPVDLHLANSGAFFSAVGYSDSGDRLLASAAAGDSRVIVATDPGAAAPAATMAEPEITGDTSATFSGEVTPGGPPGIQTSYHFEYRKTSESAWTKLPEESVGLGDGDTPVHVEQSIDSLEAAVQYEARLVATKEFGAGQTVTLPQSFMLGDLPPVVTTAYPQSRTDVTAVLTGLVNPRNLATDYYFEWGVDETYGNKVPLPAGELPALDGPQLVTERIAGLDPETLYHYRLVADNGTEVTPGDTSVEGDDVSFRTLAPAPPVAARGYEMVTPPFKPMRGAVGLGMGVRNNPNVGVPSLSGDSIAWQIPFFPLDGTVGSPANNDRRLIRRTEEGWVHETQNTLSFLPESLVKLVRMDPLGTSGDLEAHALINYFGAGLPTTGGLLPTEGPVANDYYTFRKGTGTKGITPWLDNPQEQVVEIGSTLGLTGEGYSSGYDSDHALFDDDGSAMARWGLYGGLAEVPDAAGDEDPSDDQDLLGPMVYLQRAADPLGMPSAPKDLVNECTGTVDGGDATEVPERDGNGTPLDPSDDLIASQPCEHGSLTQLRGAEVGGGGGKVEGADLSVVGPAATALADDGERVFFQTPAAKSAPSACAESTAVSTNCPPQIFVRQYGSLDPEGAVVRWVSRSRSVPSGDENAYEGPPIAGQRVALMGAGTGFEGASRDGSVVYFKTNAPLTPDDPNGTGTPGPKLTGTASNDSWDLYRYELPPEPDADPEDGWLTRISGGPDGTADPNTNPFRGSGNVNGGAARFISDDGSRAYFVTGAPIPGADQTPPLGGATTPGSATTAVSGTTRNLYLFDDTEEGADRYRFIARLPFSAGATLGNPDALGGCASFGSVLGPATGPQFDEIWPNAGVNCFRGTPDGSHVVLFTPGRLSAEDNDGAGDVYLYDAEADELTRVSAPQADAAPYTCNGEVDAPPGPGTGCNADLGFGPSSGLSGPAFGGWDTGRGWGGMRYYNLGENPDGTVSVFFQSRAELIPEDTNGDHWDTYEWRSGELSLVSRGSTAHDSWYSGNSVDGRDVFVWTSDRIDPREIDDFDFDLYDARRGSQGFAYTPPPTPCDVLAFGCESEATAPPAQPAGATAGFAGAGNVAAGKPRCGKGKLRRKGRCVKKQKAEKRKQRRGAGKGPKGGRK